MTGPTTDGRRRLPSGAGAVRRFDALFETAAPLVLAGQHQRDEGTFAATAADLGAELGADGAFESPGARTIVHSTLLHLAADVLDPRGLVDWVAAHRTLDPVGFTTDRLDVVRSRYVERPGLRWMAPECWVAFPLAGSA